MGFFKKLGKGLKNGVSGLTKMISIKNIRNIADGKFTGLGGEIVSRVTGGVKDEFTKKTVNSQGSRLDNLEELVKQRALPEDTAKGGVRIKDVATGALAGLLTGAGAAMTEDPTVQGAGVKATDNLMTAWFKKNWLKLVGAIAGVALLAVLFTKLFRSGGKRNAFK